MVQSALFRHSLPASSHSRAHPSSEHLGSSLRLLWQSCFQMAPPDLSKPVLTKLSTPKHQVIFPPCSNPCCPHPDLTFFSWPSADSLWLVYLLQASSCPYFFFIETTETNLIITSLSKILVSKPPKLAERNPIINPELLLIAHKAQRTRFTAFTYLLRGAG